LTDFPGAGAGAVKKIPSSSSFIAPLQLQGLCIYSTQDSLYIFLSALMIYSIYQFNNNLTSKLIYILGLDPIYN
jgi:hypothetical protein